MFASSVGGMGTKWSQGPDSRRQGIQRRGHALQEDSLGSPGFRRRSTVGKSVSVSVCLYVFLVSVFHCVEGGEDNVKWCEMDGRYVRCSQKEAYDAMVKKEVFKENPYGSSLELIPSLDSEDTGRELYDKLFHPPRFGHGVDPSESLPIYCPESCIVRGKRNTDDVVQKVDIEGSGIPDEIQQLEDRYLDLVNHHNSMDDSDNVDSKDRRGIGALVGAVGGGLIKDFLSQLTQPLVKGLIGDKDHHDVIKPLTNRILPHTGFLGSPEAKSIRFHLDKNEPYNVLDTFNQNRAIWHPNHLYQQKNVSLFLSECQKILPGMDKILKERLKSVSLVFNSFLASLVKDLKKDLKGDLKAVVESLNRTVEIADRILVVSEYLYQQEDRVGLFSTLAGLGLLLLLNLIMQFVCKEWLMNALSRIYLTIAEGNTTPIEVQKPLLGNV